MTIEHTYRNGELVRVANIGTSEAQIIGGSDYARAHGIVPPPPNTIAPATPTPGRFSIGARPVRMFDVECYINYFLVKFYSPLTKEFHRFVLNAWTPLDRAGLQNIMATSTIVGFNSFSYDEPMCAAALAGYNNAQLKALSNAIIGPPGGRGMKPWDLEREYGLARLQYTDHIDLIEVLPGVASLKLYGAKMHCKTIQDLPIEHTAVLTPEQMQQIDVYNDNDLYTTAAAWEMFQEQIQVRVELSNENGIDLRSRSDAQISESLFKKLLGRKVEPPYIPPGTQFFYQPPPFLKFRTEQLQQALALVLRSPFTINEKGAIEPTKELKATQVTIGSSTYQLGYGGLHSCEKTVYHRADEHTSLQDVDVASWYPEIITICKLYPPQLGPIFLQIFNDWKIHRLKQKKAGHKKKADGEKTKINGTFGKLGSRYSILNAPSLMIQVTITGQLSLLMLIEHLETAGISVVSANTDGIVIKCPRHMHDLRDMIVSHWQESIGVGTEAVNYRAIFNRDVNNYIAFKEGGGVKLKGEAFAPPVPVGPSWPNPSGEICVTAVVEYIQKGTPVAQTIRACSDFTKFVNAVKVAGGGEWVYPGGREYLGKAVRWYYATGHRNSCIKYVTDGKKVGSSDGAKPCMTLPDVLPPDIDYDHYVSIANEKLRSIGL